MSNNIENLKENQTLKSILKDSFGGIMYDVSNRPKYKEGEAELLKLWDNLSQAEKESLNGLIKGAIEFIKD